MSERKYIEVTCQCDCENSKYKIWIEKPEEDTEIEWECPVCKKTGIVNIGGEEE